MRKTVIVLDGNQRSALSATRALGKDGYYIITADEYARCLSSRSRYSKEYLRYPSPRHKPLEFRLWLAQTARQFPGAVLLPMTDTTVPLCLLERESLTDLRLPYPTLDAYSAISDKFALYQACRAANIDVPETLFIRSTAAIDEIPLRSAFPVVIKSRWSVDPENPTAVRSPVKYARSEVEFRKEVSGSFAANASSVLVQEYVSGQGQGVFGLYDRGRRLATFAHRRLREKPPSGGVSVASESIAIDPDMLHAMDELLSPVGWTGVAMAEFKVTPGGRKCLIEINGRFWGSLQLAIDCGVNFPALLCDFALGLPLPSANEYRTGRRLRWYLGELDHGYLRLRDSNLGLVAKCAIVARALVPWTSGGTTETFRWTDPGPFLAELRQYIWGSR